MKSKLFTLLCTSCLVQLVSAQNFTQWWKQVDAAAEKDQPKTAIQSLRLIRKEAIRSGDASQLLRALFTEQVMQEEIAPDSGAVMRQLIENELTKEKRPVERALWLNALGRLYTEKARNAWRENDTADIRRAHDLLLESVQQTALLGETQTQHYATLFVMGATVSRSTATICSVCSPKRSSTPTKTTISGPSRKKSCGRCCNAISTFTNNRGEEGQHSTRNGNWPTCSKEKNDWSF